MTMGSTKSKTQNTEEQDQHSDAVPPERSFSFGGGLLVFMKNET